MKRADLYALVWEKPVTHVAREFGMSDAAIRKIGVKHGIPTPSLGYWAKRAHGKKVAQTPLPPPQQGQSEHIDLRAHPRESLSPAVAETHRIAVQEELREE